MAADSNLLLHLRSRTNDASGSASSLERTVNWNPKTTAIIVCDMWDDHWCKSAARRVVELAGPMNAMLKQARDRGVFIIHAPSTVTAFYKDSPQRKRARMAPLVAPPAPLSRAERWGTCWCWPDARREGVLPIWAHRRANAPGAMQFPRVVFQNRIEGYASQTNPDQSRDDYFCLSFNDSNNENVDATSCASVFNSDKGRFMTPALVQANYSEPFQFEAGVHATREQSADVKLPPAAPSYDFDRDIKPILEASCVRCHGEAKRKSDFRLDTRDGLLQGGKQHDKVVVEGHSDKSPLVLMAAGLVEDLPMPPKGEGPRLTARQIALLRAWIDRGAKWPDGVRLVSTAVETAAMRRRVKSLSTHSRPYATSSTHG